MNTIITSYIQEKYGFDVNNATKEDLAKVTEINVSDKTMNHKYGEWDFSLFPNLKEIDCSYNPIDLLNISSNRELEKIRFCGARGDIHHKIDFSGNPHLKEVISGQDGVKELDFSLNHELESLEVFLSSSLRWIDLDNCPKLKRIFLRGANIPFVDLTHCPNLEWVSIDYFNLYRNKYGEYGPGYPRPIVFVNDNFDENIISENVRRQESYSYYLVKVKRGSIENLFLERTKAMKETILRIPEDIYGRGVAEFHYELLDLYDSLKV